MTAFVIGRGLCTDYLYAVMQTVLEPKRWRSRDSVNMVPGMVLAI